MSESTELTLPQRAAVALKSSQHEAELLVLSKKYADITEIVNGAGRDQAHGAMMELANRRVAITKAGKDARDDATKFSKAVIEEEKRLVGLIEPEEGRLRSLRDAWDQEREREKAAKAAAEKARVDTIRQSIDGLRAYPTSAVGRSATQIAEMIETIEAVEIALEIYQEFSGEAEVAKIQTVAKLGEMLTAQLAAEAEAKRLQAEREELARLRAEAEERERVAAAQRAAQEKADREAREAAEREQRAAAERAAAAMRQQRAEHEARMAAERAAAEAELRRQREEIERQQAEIAAAKAEQERIERERLAEIEAEAARIAQAEADRIFAEQRRIEAERAAEEARIQAEKDARQAEHERRVRVEFERVGPGEKKILDALAKEFEVTEEVALNWVMAFDVTRINHMEKAA